MEKARLTREQAEALDRVCQTYTAMEAIIYLHAKGATDGQEWGSYFAPLNEVGMDALCRALYVGYEIIEEEQIVTVTEEIRMNIRELFEAKSGSKQFEDGFVLGVNRVLNLTGITVKGINE